MEKKTTEHKKPSLLQAVSCLLFLFVCIIVGSMVFGIKIQPLLLVSAAYAAFMGLYLGYS